MSISSPALDHLTGVGFDPIHGVRQLKRAIQRELETSVARGILKGEHVEKITEVRHDCTQVTVPTEVTICDSKIEKLNGNNGDSYAGVQISDDDSLVTGVDSFHNSNEITGVENDEGWPEQT